MPGFFLPRNAQEDVQKADEEIRVTAAGSVSVRDAWDAAGIIRGVLLK